ncbi:MAG: YkgJ family cysteine cluster protein [Spirochaetales bacterium]
MEQLEKIYTELEQEQESWISASPFRCPSGCGRCCETYMPEVLEIEAIYMAAYFLSENKEFSHTNPSQEAFKERGCFLYDASGLYHCRVYVARPLICRLFGFSADRDKNGSLRFAPCRYTEPKLKEGGSIGFDKELPQKKQWTEQELKAYFATLPPEMARYARWVELLYPVGAGNYEPLPIALPKAYQKLCYYLRFPPEQNAA